MGRRSPAKITVTGNTVVDALFMARDRILGNEETIVAFISDKLDIEVWQLIQLANKHQRVNILQPSLGVGGHCISVEPNIEALPEELENSGVRLTS